MGGLISHEVIMGKANKQKTNKQLHQQLHLYSTVDSSCIYYLRQGCTNSWGQVATASEILSWHLISIDLQNGTSFMPKIRRWFLDFSENLCTPTHTSLLKKKFCVKCLFLCQQNGSHGTPGFIESKDMATDEQ